jgi:hypothetical protein
LSFSVDLDKADAVKIADELERRLVHDLAQKLECSESKTEAVYRCATQPGDRCTTKAGDK